MPTLRRFLGDTSGNFAVITGLCGIVLFAAAGGAVDLSRQNSAQAAAQQAADAAALAGAKAMESGTAADARKQIQMLGEANLVAGMPALTFEPVIDETGGTVQVTAKGTMTPSFLKLVSIDSLPIEAVAKSSIQGRQHIDFYFLLDVSESMNIAASEADRVLLEAYTKKYYKAPWDGSPRPCAFACHHSEDPSRTSVTVFDLNKGAGARLRIDVLRDASGRMIDKILGINDEPGSLKSTRVSTSAFSAGYKLGMTPSADDVKLKDSIRNFSDTRFFPGANNHTNIDQALVSFAATLGKQGDGSGGDKAYKVALLVTDGVRDEVDDGGAWRPDQLGTVGQAACDLVKSKGIKLAVLEVKYLKYEDKYGYFRDRVANHYDAIPDSLKTCASSGLYYQAADSGDAEAAMLALTEDLLTTRRHLTQ